MAQRRQRRGKRRRRPKLFLLAMLALLAAGFFTRRVLAPRAFQLLTRRSPSPASAHPAVGQIGPVQQSPGETLSESERRALERVLREHNR
jgi:uncharacterized membrane protein